eukprot:UN28917
MKERDFAEFIYSTVYDMDYFTEEQKNNFDITVEGAEQLGVAVEKFLIDLFEDTRKIAENRGSVEIKPKDLRLAFNLKYTEKIPQRMNLDREPLFTRREKNNIALNFYYLASRLERCWNPVV